MRNTEWSYDVCLKAAKAFKRWHLLDPKIDTKLINLLKMIRIALIGSMIVGKHL